MEYKWIDRWKISYNTLGVFLKEFDIILLTETWACTDSEIGLEGFSFYNFPRKYKHHNAKRDSGGIGIFVRDTIKKGVVIGKHHEDLFAWVKLKSEYFGMEKDVYIANIYMVPQGSVHIRDDAFSLLYEELAQLPYDSNVLLCGDYNAHTSVLPDYDIETFYGSDGDLTQLLPSDVYKSYDHIYKLHASGRFCRFSKDSRPADTQGQHLINFCKDTGLLIMNGRIGIDKGVGGCTRMGTGESSVIDYVIGSPELFDVMYDFHIGDKIPESDHLPMMFWLKCCINEATEQGSRVNWEKQWKYKWSHNELPNVKLALCDELSNQYHSTILEALSERECTNDVAVALNSYIEPYSTSLGCRRQPSLACHAWNHGKSPKSSPLSQQCRFHCHTWSAGESHYCVNSKGFMKFGTHANEESDEYQQKWLPLSDFVGLCSKYIAIPYGSMAFILKNPSFQITRCF